MGFSSKKMKDLNSKVDMMQRAVDVIPALEQIGKEVEGHADKLAESQMIDFMHKYSSELKELHAEKYSHLTGEQWEQELKKQLDMRNYKSWTDLWNAMKDWQQNHFLRYKLGLEDYIGARLPENWEQEEQLEM